MGRDGPNLDSINNLKKIFSYFKNQRTGVEARFSPSRLENDLSLYVQVIIVLFTSYKVFWGIVGKHLYNLSIYMWSINLS